MWHPVDSWTFADIFVNRVYAVPEEVQRVFPPSPSVLDLGANVGLFGLFARETLPGCRLCGYEPDPENIAVLSRKVTEGLASGWYILEEAAAGAADEKVRFALGLGDSSHESDVGHVVVKHDVLPLMASSDLVKVDIEGGEWEILDDPRLASHGPLAIVLEHHSDRCPTGDPAEAAERRLIKAGYRIVAHDRHPSTEGLGTLWALRQRNVS